MTDEEIDDMVLAEAKPKPKRKATRRKSTKRKTTTRRRTAKPKTEEPVTDQPDILIIQDGQPEQSYSLRTEEPVDDMVLDPEPEPERIAAPEPEPVKDPEPIDLGKTFDTLPPSDPEPVEDPPAPEPEQPFDWTPFDEKKDRKDHGKHRFSFDEKKPSFLDRFKNGKTTKTAKKDKPAKTRDYSKRYENSAVMKMPWLFNTKEQLNAGEQIKPYIPTGALDEFVQLRFRNMVYLHTIVYDEAKGWYEEYVDMIKRSELPEDAVHVSFQAGHYMLDTINVDYGYHDMGFGAIDACQYMESNKITDAMAVKWSALSNLDPKALVPILLIAAVVIGVFIIGGGHK